MGAGVVSETSELPLTETRVSSPKQAMNDIDQDETETLSSTIESTEMIEGTASNTTDERSCQEIRNHDGNVTKGYHTTTKCDKEKQLNLFGMLIFEANAFTFVIIPAMLVAAYAYFGAVSVSSPLSMESPTALGITAIASFVSTLGSYISGRYMQALEEYPVVTKALTTGTIQFFGDFAAQRYEQQQQNGRSEAAYDLRRGLSLFADGLLLSGPLLHYCFEWMEEIWPTSEEVGSGGGLARPLATLCHVFVNDYIIDSIYIALSFFFTGIVEGYSLREVAGIFRKDYGATVRASWVTSLGLIPVEILCFGYLSLSFRVLAMNFVDLLWGAIVSFYSHRSRREHPAPEPEKVADASK